MSLKTGFIMFDILPFLGLLFSFYLFFIVFKSPATLNKILNLFPPTIKLEIKNEFLPRK